MEPTDIIRLANQIALNLAAYPPDEAEAAVAGHIAQFWDPRMRAALAGLTAAQAKDLHPLAAAARQALKEAR